MTNIMSWVWDKYDECLGKDQFEFCKDWMFFDSFIESIQMLEYINNFFDGKDWRIVISSFGVHLIINPSYVTLYNGNYGNSKIIYCHDTMGTTKINCESASHTPTYWAESESSHTKRFIGGYKSDGKLMKAFELLTSLELDKISKDKYPDYDFTKLDSLKQLSNIFLSDYVNIFKSNETQIRTNIHGEYSFSESLWNFLVNIGYSPETGLNGKIIDVDAYKKYDIKEYIYLQQHPELQGFL